MKWLEKKIKIVRKKIIMVRKKLLHVLPQDFRKMIVLPQNVKKPTFLK